MYKSSFIAFLVGCITIAACRKNDGGAVAPPVGSRLELSLDSLYRYAQETYLWHNALPDYANFVPRQYATQSPDIAALQAALNAVTSYAVDPATGQRYEYKPGFSQPLYSYIAPGNIITGRTATVGLDGKGNDMGLHVAVVDDKDVYIRMVEPGSPAAIAGLKRGMKIIQLNGQPVTADPAILKGTLEAEAVELLLQLQGGEQQVVSLNKTSYTASPVLHSKVVDAGGKKVAYIALARFTTPAHAAPALQQVFAAFEGQPVTNIVVDLRYNSGGYVETAQYLADLIAPSAIDGKVMYQEQYNELLQQGRAPILKTIPYLDANRQPVMVNGRPATYADIDYSLKGNTYRFAKKGNLTGIRSVVFIVSGATASASEQLINCFKPYVDVQLVGSTTYGKPVGFFGIGIDVYTLYLAQFRILNAAGEGEYYTGFTPDFPAPDDVARDFGDPSEACLAQALQYISGSPYRSGSSNRSLQTVIPVHASDRFTGVVETRWRLR